MIWIALVCSLSLSTMGQQAENEWIDPYDMINYNPSTKTMKKPAEQTHYSNVVTKRREYVEEQSQEELTSCKQQAVDLQRQVEELRKEITLTSQQPTCNPVFKRFLSRLLKEIQRVGAPSDSTDMYFDAQIKLSKQAMMEIQSFLEGEDGLRTGALDSAIGQILVALKPHNYKAWIWHFEDTFGVELDTVLKVAIFFLIISAIICTQLWSTVSWFVQFRRLLAVCFIVSIVWNWFYLYKIAYAEHQNNIVKMDSVNDKCTGVRKIDWTDNLKEWFRSTWTLQDDPCKKYYEVLIINPILLVPPTKAIAVTITAFITDPMKHLGQGISEFLRALLKDLPLTLQIPVLLTVMLAILVFMYGGVHAAFQHGIMGLFRRPPRDPPPPGLREPQPPILMVENRGNLAGGDAPAVAHAPPIALAQAQQCLPRNQVNDARLHRNAVHQRHPTRAREKPAPMVVETLRTAEHYNHGDETDADRHDESPETAENLSENSENQEETQEETDEASAHSNTTNSAQSETRCTTSDLSESKNKLLKGKKETPPNKLKENLAAAKSKPGDRQSSQIDGPDPEASGEESTSSVLHVENVGLSVQETCAVDEEETASVQDATGV